MKDISNNGIVKSVNNFVVEIEFALDDGVQIGEILQIEESPHIKIVVLSSSKYDNSFYCASLVESYLIPRARPQLRR